MFLILTAALLLSNPNVSIVGKKFKQGDIFVVAVKTTSRPETLEGEFLGKKLIFFPGAKETVLALVGIDLDAEPGKTKITVSTEPKFESEIDIQKRKFKIQKLEVEDKFVSPQGEDLKRSEKEAEELKEIFLTRNPNRYFEEKFLRPLHAKSSGRFGERRMFNGVPKNPHGGEDLKAKEGTPVKSTASGKVALAKETFYLGNTVVIDHGCGLVSYYGHLSKLVVKAGDQVKGGDVIGEVGKTGRATGAHLHWGIKLYNERVDPMRLLKIDLISYLK